MLCKRYNESAKNVLVVNREKKVRKNTSHCGVQKNVCGNVFVCFFPSSNCFKYSLCTHSLSLALIQYSNFCVIFLSLSLVRSFYFVSLIIPSFLKFETREKKQIKTQINNKNRQSLLLLAGLLFASICFAAIKFRLQ